MTARSKPLARRLSAILLLGGFLCAAAIADEGDAKQHRRKGHKGAQSQPTTTQASQPTTTSTSTSTTSTTSAEADEKEKDHWLAVTHGRVYTVTGPVLEDATILAKNGKIVAIGDSLRLPDECEVLDAAGRYVYPGLVACGASGIFAGSDPRDGTNLYGLNLNLALAAGITTALSGDSVAKLTFGTTDGMLLRKDAFIELRYDTRSPLNRAETRAAFERVRNYLRDVKAYEIEKETDKDAKAPEKDWLKGKYEQYRKLIAGEAVAISTANRVDELRGVIELARQFGFHLVLRGAFEGWIIPDELGRARVSAIVSPRTDVGPDTRYNRANGSSIENANILRNHGVTVATIPQQTVIALWGLAGQDLFHMAMEAAFAVRGGMSNDDAIRTITIDAARILGVDDRVGSIEVGKDADLVITDGDLLHFMTQVHHTVVNGQVVYDKAKQSWFAHIRPDSEQKVAEFDDQWPRKLEWRD